MFDSYITKEWYRDTYPSVNKFTSDDNGLNAAIFDASRIIDEQTFDRATLFDDLDADLQTCIKYAVAAQVDYIVSLGYNPEDLTSADYSGGFSLGKYSESAKGGDTRAKDTVAPKALKYLRAGNLTHNGFKDRNNPSRYTFGRSMDISGDLDA